MTSCRIPTAALLSFLLVGLAACADARTPSGSAPTDTGDASTTRDRLEVVATTTILGDVVRQVTGDAVDLTVLLPVGADPHGFQASPQDAARIAGADLVFVNGLGLEGSLDRLIQNAGGTARIVEVSDGVMTIAGQPAHDDEGEENGGESEGADSEHEGEAPVHEGEDSEPEDGDPELEGENPEHEGADPHVWTDPNNVRVWTRNIAAAVSALDPANAAEYQTNAVRYDQILEALDGWIRERVEQILPENRRMVVDHHAFGYFAQRYGFETVGAVVPGYSSMSAPSADELARLEDAIRGLGVKAVFVGSTVNADLARRVADDTGTQLVFVLTGSLGEPDGGADTYEGFMRHNVNSIVDALK